MTIRNRRAFSAMTLSSILALAFTASAAHAALQEQTMIELASNRSSDVNVLSAIVDKSSVAKGLAVAVVNNGQVLKHDTFTIAQIGSPEGVVLASDSGMAAVILQANIDSSSGGQAVIRYLTNALTRAYASCKAIVRRAKDGRWNIVNAYTGEVVTHAYVQTWAMGISAIKGLCPGQYFSTPEEQEAAIREWQLQSHP